MLPEGSTAAGETVDRVVIVSDNGIVYVSIAVDLPGTDKSKVNVSRLSQIADVAETCKFISIVLTPDRISSGGQFELLRSDYAVLNYDGAVRSMGAFGEKGGDHRKSDTHVSGLVIPD